MVTQVIRAIDEEVKLLKMMKRAEIQWHSDLNAPKKAVLQHMACLETRVQFQGISRGLEQMKMIKFLDLLLILDHTEKHLD